MERGGKNGHPQTHNGAFDDGVRLIDGNRNHAEIIQEKLKNPDRAYLGREKKDGQKGEFLS